MNDRQKLETLRISIARIAQALGVSGTSIDVTAREAEWLIALARTEEFGWNELAARCVDAIQERDRRAAMAWHERNIAIDKLSR